MTTLEKFSNKVPTDEISRNEFFDGFDTPDFNWHSNNIIGSHFDKIKSIMDQLISKAKEIENFDWWNKDDQYRWETNYVEITTTLAMGMKIQVPDIMEVWKNAHKEIKELNKRYRERLGIVLDGFQLLKEK